ncbi:glycerophosphodiester phosphodiesterase GDPDL6 [Amborella trichopoda]|uniref:glycerophosphodiester phosphodiesterase n=1 Tax=Amborella trichopoda TaxID=13333 RepID=W1NRQ6_AMBTC|nr:glycerophosphodiester phosphodiesterase GDPDL6 [Amborella trichopoda]XP_020517661.1 glycerophosphodiester phosphodiesterase GDPDL6 [Amborella trichopoda]XP_020517662.1 glycerophosphodiester phosphodiesterase GDPDL6 [Amborella trichopoda]ERM97414.1 hypothetical protein AMTR_s00252p00015420 [Amborella trichopoda]|eukprot:XP_006829998.1 glycerophosphodiester phosphodiesterase GDPDL6 [Amborella trichopoda]
MGQNVLLILFLLQGCWFSSLSGQKSSSKWATLSGNAPEVIARGGFSGLFPESSDFANSFALSVSLSNVVLLCELQLTKDGRGICRSDLRLDNSTNIADVYPHNKKTYIVNGKPLQGWFAIDFLERQLFNKVTLIQNIFSRPSIFDNVLPIAAVEDVQRMRPPPRFWLSVQYDTFYTQNKLDMASYVISLSKTSILEFVSSPEVGLLKNINGKLKGGKTKLIFQFLKPEDIEPSTKKTYASLLENLSSIKAFASGVLVPKNYIWAVNSDLYLKSPTTLVKDAHKVGLEVYASGFANDFPASYNYSYDPVAEYLQFIDKSDFSVDGVLTDFPSTASEAVGCLARSEKSATPSALEKPLIITHNGASGVYAGCTDLAYKQAVKDGADIIDCSVQMTKDGFPICMTIADLTGDTTAMPSFMSRAIVIQEIQENSGIFSFDLTWEEIQTLKPVLNSPLGPAAMPRNPAVKNEGKFMALHDFLVLAKDMNVTGVLINVENAFYLASKKGLSITDSVLDTLRNASYDKENSPQVMIQSGDSAVLSKIKKVAPSYKRVYLIDEIISDANKLTVEEIKQFSDAVNLPRASIMTNSGSFLVSLTDVVDKMHSANISVFISVLRNEFVTIAFDFFADPTMEINTYVKAVGVDGIVTEYPATASAYMGSPCFSQNEDAAYTILPVEAGALLGLVNEDALPPAEAPAPVLTVADVEEPPLPSLADASKNTQSPAPTATPSPSGVPTGATISVALCLVTMVLGLLSLGHH